MLDVSGSTQSQLAQIREAANTFVGRLRFNDRMMAITFDGQIHVLTEPALVSDIRRGKLRSEEHTSELQSHLNLVCRLLLEKKKRDPTAQQSRQGRNWTTAISSMTYKL